MSTSTIGVQRIVPRGSVGWQSSHSPPKPDEDDDEEAPERKSRYGSKKPGTGQIVDRKA